MVALILGLFLPFSADAAVVKCGVYRPPSVFLPIEGRKNILEIPADFNPRLLRPGEQFNVSIDRVSETYVVTDLKYGKGEQTGIYYVESIQTTGDIGRRFSIGFYPSDGKIISAYAWDTFSTGNGIYYRLASETRSYKIGLFGDVSLKTDKVTYGKSPAELNLLDVNVNALQKGSNLKISQDGTQRTFVISEIPERRKSGKILATAKARGGDVLSLEFSPADRGQEGNIEVRLQHEDTITVYMGSAPAEP